MNKFKFVVYFLFTTLVVKLVGSSQEHEPSDKLKARSPRYIEYYLNKMDNYKLQATRTDSTTQASKKRYKIFDAWLPSEITESPSNNRTIVHFQQNLDRQFFGNFSSSHITLTMRNDVDLEDEYFLPNTQKYISMYTHWGNATMQQELIQTRPILKTQQFWSFSITEFITSCLQNHLTHPHLVNISFHVHAGHTAGEHVLDFTRFFDVQVDLPIIVFLYGKYVPRKNASNGYRRRSRRATNKESESPALSGRPDSQCQRRQLVVTPSDLSLAWNIVEPTKIDMGYCDGSCPHPLMDQYFNFTMYSFIISHYKLNRILQTPRGLRSSATCVPASFRPISVLEQFDSDKFEAFRIPDLAIETCRCTF